MVSISVSWVLIGLFILCVFTLMPIRTAEAQGGDAAMMGDISVSAEPESQGAGGPITISVEIPFYGGCCYPLWAYDVQAELKMPENIIIVDGPTPPSYPEIEAKAGGAPDFYYIKWTVKSMVPDDYDVTVIVTTENCGSGEGMTGFMVTEGCVMTIPEIYPELAPTNRDISLKMEAMSPIEGIIIEELNLFYYTNDNELNVEKTKGDTIFFKDGTSESGILIALERDESEAYLWKGVIPSQSSSCFLYYWTSATDNEGNMTTSPAYTLKIEDLEEANMTVNLAILLPILFTVIGMLFAVIFVKFNQKRVYNRKKDGLLVMGGEEGFDLEVETEQNIKSRKRIKSMRGIVYIALLIITVVLLAWAVNENLYEDILYVVEGGL
jgi:hypothetical protein